MKEYLPYISLILAVGGMIFAAGRRDKGYESELIILKSRVSEIRNNTVKRIHERIEKIHIEIAQCVTQTNLDLLKEMNTDRFDKIELHIKELSNDIKNMCRQVVKLETNLCNLSEHENKRNNH